MPAGQTGPSQTGSDGPHTPDARHFFGAGLEPALVRACGDRLTQLHWFRTDWQRGGALTGYGRYAGDNGEHEVVVKLPVPPAEATWLDRLQPHRHDAGDVVPRLFARGDRVNGYDLAWVVMERLPHGPLDSSWDGAEWDLLIQAMGRFYAAAEKYPVDDKPRQEDWPAIVKRARGKVRDHSVQQEQRWNKALKALGKKLPKMLERWHDRPIEHWCHGDVHLPNAMTRNQAPQGPALVFDLANVHAGHWVEDAVYLEHIYWGRDDRLKGRKPASMLAKARKAMGLEADADWPHLANIRRVLLAAAAPAYLKNQGDPTHLAGALAVLERLTPQV